MSISEVETLLLTTLREIDWSREAAYGARVAALKERYDSHARGITEIAAELADLSERDSEPDDTLTSATVASSRRRPRKTMRDYCLEILASGPLHTDEITRRMLAGGYETNGKSPERSVVTVLIRHPDLFEPLGDGFYRLRTGA